MKLFLSNLLSLSLEISPRAVKNTDALCGLLAEGGRDSSRSIK